MQVVETIAALREARTRLAAPVGFVPTMGALHAGHASLLQKARRENASVVASIFVNPAQFAPHEDLAKYPRPFEADVAACAAEGVDVLFHPSPAEMYAPGFQTYVEVTQLQQGLCGASRPTHFRGVATVVLKLFNLVQPHVAYFGQKDAQQARVLQQMVQDLAVPVELRLAPIVREPDGLAMSSRNQYLNPQERRQALALNQVLAGLRQRIEAGARDGDALAAEAGAALRASPGVQLDYVAVVDFETLAPLRLLRGKVLIAVAAWVGATRLIDNLLVEVP